MSKKQPIQVINNYKALLELMPSNIYDNTYMFNENITSIVNQRQHKINDYIISEIIKFMEKENIRLCFVINEEEMVDCLQEHNKLHLKIKDLQSQLDQQKAMWNELKEHISNQIIHYDELSDKFKEENNDGCVLLANSKRSMIEEILYKMQELEKGEKE